MGLAHLHCCACLLKLGLGFLDNRAKACRVGDCQLGKDLAVDPDFSLFHAVNQAAV